MLARLQQANVAAKVVPMDEGCARGQTLHRRALLRQAAVLGLLGSGSRRGQAAPVRELSWAMVDWPPLFVFDPARPPTRVSELGDGVADLAMAEVVARLPQFEHRFVPVSGRRLWRALSGEQGSSHCFAALLKTPEREQQLHLLPWSPMPPQALVLRAEAAARLPEGEVSLTELLRRGELRGALETNRSYGALPDRLLAEAGQALAREEVAAPGQLLRLVAAGRYDYTLEYPLAVEQMRRGAGPVGAPGDGGLQLRPLTELRDWPVLHMACRRGPAGLELAQALAVAICEAARSRGGLRNAVPRWLPAAQRAAARARLEPFFEQLARAPTRVE
jgi:uncharacterized protein (TIGR02285 family)